MNDNEAAVTNVPYTALQPATLRSLIEEFVTRDTTDYGERERTLEDKVADVMRQLRHGEAHIVFDGASETINIVVATTPWRISEGVAGWLKPSPFALVWRDNGNPPESDAGPLGGRMNPGSLLALAVGLALAFGAATAVLVGLLAAERRDRRILCAGLLTIKALGDDQCPDAAVKVGLMQAVALNALDEVQNWRQAASGRTMKRPGRGWPLLAFGEATGKPLRWLYWIDSSSADCPVSSCKFRA